MGLDICIAANGNRHDFRKYNWLMPFVEKAIGSEVENCEYYRLSKETMLDLLERIDEVLADHSLAQALLPSRSGFFFGSTEYDDRYFNALRITKEELTEDVKSMNDNDTARFWSWW